MTFKKMGGPWLAVSALVAGAMVSGCNASTTTEDATTGVSQAVEASSDSSDAVEVSSLMRGTDKLRTDAVEGFHCDSSPDISYVDVCGKTQPAAVHLEWTDCAAPERPGGGGHGGDGQRPPPPPAGTTGYSTVSGLGGHGGGGPLSGDGACKQGDRGPHGGPSSGTVDITYTYETPNGCEGAVTQNQSVTYLITRTDSEGNVSTVEGTSASSAQLVDGTPPQQKTTQADITRKLIDASGTVVRSVHLNGSLSTDFSSDTPPVRTINGSYTEEFLDGTTGTVTLANLVRPPRNVCPWPTSGTLTRGSSDGTTHELVFGPDCGTATLDGTTVEMPSRGPGGPGGGEGRR
jgi:hypothetical protein